MREDPEGRLVQGASANGEEAAAEQTASGTAGTAWAVARADCRDWKLAAVGGAGLLQLSRSAGNFAALQTFRREVARAWLAALRRRSQRRRLPWERFRSIIDRWLPLPRILHPEPGVRFDAKYSR